MRIKEKSVKTEIKTDKTQVSIRIERRNRRGCDYEIIENSNKVIKKAHSRKSNLSEVLWDVVRENDYLYYFDPRRTHSIYSISDTCKADIGFHLPKYDAWEVIVSQENHEPIKKQFSIKLSQGEVVDRLLNSIITD